MKTSNKQTHISELIEQMSLPESFQQTVEDIYLPLSQVIVNSKKGSPLFVSINGAQGTGKSTMTAFLKSIIEYESDCAVANISIDDFYCTRERRKFLAESIHPLLETRGVPGTHDVVLIEQVLDCLVNQKPCQVPRFDKALDDRRAESGWGDIAEPVDIILFEGWCNNSPAQSRQALTDPVNELESTEDPEGVWRQYVNEQLIDYQRRLFDHADMCIMLQAPDFECVYEWRSKQEQKLEKNSKHLESNRVMNAAELKRFIQHYERISRHTLAHLPQIADVVLPVAEDHSIKALVERSRSLK